MTIKHCDCGSGGCRIVILASSVCPLMGEDKRLPDGRYWFWGKLHLDLVGRDMLSKFLIQFSDGWGCVPIGSKVG